MINGSIQEKNGCLYAVLRIPTGEGKTKQKWVNMGMKSTEPKRKKRERFDEIRIQYSDIANLEAVETRFCDFIVKWNEETKEDKSITTYDNYSHMITKYIYPYFSEKGTTVFDLRPADIEGYYRYLKRIGLSGKTALNHHQIIYTSLKYAVFNRILKENPAEFVKRPKKSKAEHETYDAEELKELMKAAKGDVLESVIFLTLWYGLRREEILGLRWSNVNFEKHEFRICETVVRGKVDGKWTRVERQTTKTDSSNRVLPMSETVETYLRQLIKRQQENRVLCGNCYTESDFVCVNRMGEPINPDYVTHHYGDLLKKSGLKKITFHELRHSCATYMIEAGYTPFYVKELLGHSSSAFTESVYIHAGMGHKQEMIETITSEIVPIDDNAQ